MKLTAPSSKPEPRNLTVPEAISPPEPPANSASPPPPASPPANTAPTTATWPKWFGPVDVLLTLLAVSLAFFLASFVARNSQVWLHLATGRLLAQGQYSFGTDPFSYATAGRVWVNHSWLFDFLIYQLFTAFGGAVLVGLKAAGIAVASVALLAIRRPGFARWPWVACLTIALLAAAPRFSLSPVACSVIFLALLMFLLFRVPGPAGSWRLPILVGVLFAVWANVDAWFFIGPFAVALLLAGAWLAGRGGESAKDEPSEPLGTLPARSTLARALVIGILACLLNPHHVRVWQLPLEVSGSSSMSAEPMFKRTVLLSPLDSDYVDYERNGQNINGVSYAVLLLGGGLAFIFGTGRTKLGHLFVWFGFAVLSLVTVVAIPFFAIVSVPLVAAQLNTLSARIKLGLWTDQGTRLWVLGSSLGRLLSLLTLAILLALALPGWLHPKPDMQYETPRVAWGIESDPALRQAAEQLEAWRTSGAIPPAEHGFLLSTNLANYCAWFAPSEKVFINSRFSFHEPELRDYTFVRANVGTRPDANAPPNMTGVASIFKQYDVGYMGLYERGRVWGRLLPRLLHDEAHWDVWYLDGRTGLFGWRASPTEGSPAFSRLKLDPVAVAFGSPTPKAPRERNAPPVELSILPEELYRPTLPAPTEADEVIAWMDYKIFLMEQIRERRQLAQMSAQFLGAAGPMTAVVSFSSLEANAGMIWRDRFAIPLIALRTARRAIAANPDHADSYFALYRVLADPDLPMMSKAERKAATLHALLQCLARIPAPQDYKPMALTFSPAGIAATLAISYLDLSEMDLENGLDAIVGAPRVGTLNLARQALETAIKYAEVELGEAGDANPDLAQLKDQWSRMATGIENELLKQNGRYEDMKTRQPELRNRYVLARQLGLTDVALQLLQDADLPKEFGPGWLQIAFQRIGLELILGRLDEANQHLAEAAQELKRPELPKEAADFLRPLFEQLLVFNLQLQGEYGAAGARLEETSGRTIGQIPKPYRQYLTLGLLNAYTPGFEVSTPLGTLSALFQGNWRFSLLLRDMSLLRRQDADYFYQRGILALCEGKNAAARDFFQQTARPPLNGWPLPPTRPFLARAYIELIGTAQKK